MALWRVDVNGLSHRYVEAESRDDAVELVRAAVLREIDLRASAAPSELARRFDAASPLQGKRLLAAMDGLTSPVSKRSSAGARRALERLAKHQDELNEWVKSASASAPPASPEIVDRLVKWGEVEYVERNLERFVHEARSALHEG